MTASVAHFDVIFIENLVVFILCSVYSCSVYSCSVYSWKRFPSMADIVSNNIYSPIFILPLGFSRSRITLGQFLGTATDLQSFLITSFTSVTDLFVTPCITESNGYYYLASTIVFQDGSHGLI